MMGSVEHCSQASEYYGQVSEKCGVFLSVKRRYWLLIFSRWKSNAEEMSDCRRFSGLAELHWPAKHLISGAAKGQSLSNLGLLVQRFRFECMVTHRSTVTGQTIHEAYSRDFFLGN